jgi:hypothetical protein
VVTDDERERAWGAVHDAIAQMPGWAVGPCSYHAEVALWYVTAIDLRPRGRYARREAITATGDTTDVFAGTDDWPRMPLHPPFAPFLPESWDAEMTNRTPMMRRADAVGWCSRARRRTARQPRPGSYSSPASR